MDGGGKLASTKIVATDGVEAFAVTLTAKDVDKAQSPASEMGRNEWRAIVSAVLEGRRAGRGEVEVDAVVKAGDGMTVMFRRSVGHAKIRLGDIDILASEAEEVSLLDWVGEGCLMREEAMAQLEHLSARIEKHEETIKLLKSQLDDLTKAKRDHESLLLAKFTAILNTKKRRIRAMKSARPLSEIETSSPRGQRGSRGKKRHVDDEEDGSDLEMDGDSRASSPQAEREDEDEAPIVHRRQVESLSRHTGLRTIEEDEDMEEVKDEPPSSNTGVIRPASPAADEEEYDSDLEL
ncbi:hypothetical protein SAICODRAFT_7278 [Saitoella complicata NRRL Y-17804]|uniref:uncharacterized protein n=1 Tax=Saitoella complicata (strain BCRC 22490 / CBS 7301 / JCM 7358 / NBRC 10748 / NRRL Y-17804) TaxID=698492 RepID=UPI000867CB0A|nr:uncharacterized protein SAICODRAFT_7278 [Saitoella complicata NRRL Y-17804]ODQ53120.1 hypothetical protein SAICODRAFT_7278 [Saitoella complicata NRRL Y-17804]